MLKELSNVMNENVTVNMTIKKIGDTIMVIVVPKSNVEDPAYKNLPPFSCSGTPEAVEAALIDGIMNPIHELSTTLVGVKEFLDKKAEADKENAVKKSEKAVAEKAEKKAEKKSEKKIDKAEAPKEVEKPKSKAELEFNQLIVDGEKAISEKRDITAKSIKAKLYNLISGSILVPEEEARMQEKLNDYQTKLDLLEQSRTGVAKPKAEPEFVAPPEVVDYVGTNPVPDVNFDEIRDKLDSEPEVSTEDDF